jgi:hypothetical protein
VKANSKKYKLNEADTTADSPGTKGYSAFLKGDDVSKQRKHLSKVIEKTTGYIMLREQLKKMIKSELIKMIGMILIIFGMSSCTGTFHIAEPIRTTLTYDSYYTPYYNTVTYIKPYPKYYHSIWYNKHHYTQPHNSNCHSKIVPKTYHGHRTK